MVYLIGAIKVYMIGATMVYMIGAIMVNMTGATIVYLIGALKVYKIGATMVCMIGAIMAYMIDTTIVYMTEANWRTYMEGYRAHNSNTHYALCLIPFTGYGCVSCFITKCLSVVCILRSTK